MCVTRCKWFVVFALALSLAACGRSDSTKDSAPTATVEDRGISNAEMAEIDAGAESQGLEDVGPYAPTSLGDPNDPNSPLSVRVIYFDYDSSNVRSDFRSIIEAHANYLAANPSITMRLEGHADERGSREYNLALGERRALSVRKQLVLLGASATQINSVSFGEEQPLNAGHDEQSYALNRRVEIVY